MEVPGVVHQDVDTSEAIYGGPRCRLGGREVRNIELDDEQVIRIAHGLGHRSGAAAARDDCVTCGERRPDEVDAHPAASAGNEPDALVSHTSPPLPLSREATRRMGLACASVRECPPSA